MRALPYAVAILWVALAGVACAETPASRPEAPPAASASAVPGEVTLVGKVEAGVEPKCYLMSHAGTQYLLLGGDPAVVYPGAHVTVRGRSEPGRVTTCMQGVPLQVIEAHPGGHH